MFPDVRAILWDLDGTISNPAPGLTRCVHHAMETVGIRQRLAITDYIGPPLHDWLPKILERFGKERFFNEALAAFRQAYDNDGPNSGKYENDLYDGIPEALDTLKDRGYRLFVATSKPTPIALDILAFFNLTDRFEAIVGSGMDGTRRNKDEVIAHVLAEYKLAPTETVMIGDRSHDIVGARKNNLDSIGVTWGFGSAEELQGAGATALADRAADLVRLLSPSV